MSSDGSVIEMSPIASKVARNMIGDFDLSPGGLIVLSTDVNANKNKNFWMPRAKTFMQTWWNRITRLEKIDETLVDELKKTGIETGWSVGNFFKGRYYSQKQNQTFNEKSFTIDIIGVPMDFIKQAARALGKTFNQESVLIIDHSNGRATMLDT